MLDPSKPLGLDSAALGPRLTELGRRLRRSSFFLNLSSVAGASVVSNLISLVTLGYSARVLGPENYGLFGFGTAVTAYAGILLSPGLLTWGIRSIAQDRDKAGLNLVIINLTQLILAGLTYLGIAIYAQLFFAQPAQRTMVLLCALSLFQTALSVEWVYNGLELMRVPALCGIFISALVTIGLLTLIRSPQDLFVLPLIGIFAALLIYAVQYWYLLRRLQVRLQFPDWRQVRQTLLASLPLGVWLGLVIVLHYANNLIVHAFLGSAALGVFLAAYRLWELTDQIPGILAKVFLPRLARLVSDTPRQAPQEALVYARIHMTIGFLLAALAAAEAPAIIGIIFGSKYLGAVILLRIMAFAILFHFAIRGYTDCLISFGQDRVMLMVVIISTVVSVGGGLLLVPRLGVVGAAVVVAAIDFAGWLSSLPFYRRKIGSLQFRAWGRPALGGGAVVAISLLLQTLGLSVWFRLPLVLLTYLPFLLLEVKQVLK